MAIKCTFPGDLWDGLTGWRGNLNTQAAPDAEDWAEMLAEVQSIEKTLFAASDDAIIWVEQHARATGTGSITNPVASINDAVARLSVTKSIIAILPGIYDLDAIAVIPDLPFADSNVRVVGVGGSAATIINAGDTDEAIQVYPIHGTSELHNITIEGITLNQFAGKIGIKVIDRLGASDTKLTLKDVNLNMDTAGASFFQNTTYGTKCHLVMEHCNVTGAIDFTYTTNLCNNEFTHCNLLGGVVTSADNHAIEYVFRDSMIKAGGISGGFASQIIKALNCFTDAHEAVSESDFVGAHTVTILGSGGGGGAEEYVDDTLWVGPQGTGTGSRNNPYGTIAEAIAAMTQTKHILCVLPGEYIISSQIVLPDITNFVLIGIGGSKATTFTHLLGGTVFLLQNDQRNDDLYLTFQGIKFDKNGSGGLEGPAIKINQGEEWTTYWVTLNDIVVDRHDRCLDLETISQDYDIKLDCNDCNFGGTVNIETAGNGGRYFFDRCYIENGVLFDNSFRDKYPEFWLKNSESASCHVFGGTPGRVQAYVINSFRTTKTNFVASEFEPDFLVQGVW
jgi:hypothetical protein